MARRPRFVVPDAPHHITQRGSNRQAMFLSDEDRQRYLAPVLPLCDASSMNRAGEHSRRLRTSRDETSAKVIRSIDGPVKSASSFQAVMLPRCGRSRLSSLPEHRVINGLLSRFNYSKKERGHGVVAERFDLLRERLVRRMNLVPRCRGECNGVVSAPV